MGRLVNQKLLPMRDKSTALRPPSSAVSHPPSVLRLLRLFAANPPSSVVCHPSSVVCPLSSVSLPSDFCASCASLRPILRRPPSVIRPPSSVYRLLLPTCPLSSLNFNFRIQRTRARPASRQRGAKLTSPVAVIACSTMQAATEQIHLRALKKDKRLMARAAKATGSPPLVDNMMTALPVE